MFFTDALIDFQRTQNEVVVSNAPPVSNPINELRKLIDSNLTPDTSGIVHSNDSGSYWKLDDIKLYNWVLEHEVQELADANSVVNEGSHFEGSDIVLLIDSVDKMDTRKASTAIQSEILQCCADEDYRKCDQLIEHALSKSLDVELLLAIYLATSTMDDSLLPTRKRLDKILRRRLIDEMGDKGQEVINSAMW